VQFCLSRYHVTFTNTRDLWHIVCNVTLWLQRKFPMDIARRYMTLLNFSFSVLSVYIDFRIFYNAVIVI